MTEDQQIAQGLLKPFVDSGKFPEFSKLLTKTGDVIATNEMIEQGNHLAMCLALMHDEVKRLTSIARWALNLNIPIGE